MKNVCFFVSGGWGDALVAYGNVCKYLDEKSLEKADLIFYGTDLQIVKFLRDQNRIDKVSALEISDLEQYLKYAKLSKSNFAEFKKVTGLQDFMPELMSAHTFETWHKEVEIILPQQSSDLQSFFDVHKEYLVFNPYSCHSTLFQHHWIYWMLALEYVLEEHDIQVVLTGQLMSETDNRFKFPWIEHKNLTNMVGQTKSMFEVFDIVKQSRGVITTSGALSLFSEVFKKPSLVVCDQKIADDNPDKYKWILGNKNNTVYDSDLALFSFEKEFVSWYDCLN